MISLTISFIHSLSLSLSQTHTHLRELCEQEEDEDAGGNAVGRVAPPVLGGVALGQRDLQSGHGAGAALGTERVRCSRRWAVRSM